MVAFNRLPNETPLLKLADFGISKKLGATEKDVTIKSRGSTGWMAPELCTIPAEYTKAVDIFSAGLVLFYAKTCGKHLFSPSSSSFDIDYDVCHDNIRHGRKRNLELLDEDVLLQDLIESMTKRDTNNRPSVEEISNHPYFWDSKKALEFIRFISEKTENHGKKRSSSLYHHTQFYNYWKHIKVKSFRQTGESI